MHEFTLNLHRLSRCDLVTLMFTVSIAIIMVRTMCHMAKHIYGFWVCYNFWMNCFVAVGASVLSTLCAQRAEYLPGLLVRKGQKALFIPHFHFAALLKLPTSFCTKCAEKSLQWSKYRKSHFCSTSLCSFTFYVPLVWNVSCISVRALLFRFTFT